MSEDVLTSDINTATKLISEAADPDVEMIFGTSFDPELKDEINITVIAAAFNDDPSRAAYEPEEPAAPEVEVIPAKKTAQETRKAAISEDYTDFFNMINRQ